jgi:hypothetical protein
MISLVVSPKALSQNHDEAKNRAIVEYCTIVVDHALGEAYSCFEEAINELQKFITYSYGIRIMYILVC